MNTPNTCSSHMPILLEFMDRFKPKTTLELGGGYFSTAAILKAERAYTVEASHEWMDRIQKHFGCPDHWNMFHFVNAKDTFTRLAGMTPFDFILVDGEDRAACLFWALENSKTVMLHDAQWTWSHGWKLRPEWTRIDFKKWPHMYDHPEANTADQRPWTSLFTSQAKVVEHFTEMSEEDLYAKYPYPYGLEIPSE